MSSLARAILPPEDIVSPEETRKEGKEYEKKMGKWKKRFDHKATKDVFLSAGDHFKSCPCTQAVVGRRRPQLPLRTTVMPFGRVNCW